MSAADEEERAQLLTDIGQLRYALGEAISIIEGASTHVGKAQAVLNNIIRPIDARVTARVAERAARLNPLRFYCVHGTYLGNQEGVHDFKCDECGD